MLYSRRCHFVLEMQLILTAFIVSSGLTFVRPNHQLSKTAVASQINDDSRIQTNFHHFLDSITYNDEKKAKTYRNILKQDTMKEQEAFDTMKEGLHFARQKNTRNQRNANPKDGNVIISKRETSGKRTSDNDHESGVSRVEPANDDRTGPDSSGAALGGRSHSSDFKTKKVSPKRKVTRGKKLVDDTYLPTQNLQMALQRADIESFMDLLVRNIQFPGIHGRLDGPASEDEVTRRLHDVLRWNGVHFDDFKLFFRLPASRWSDEVLIPEDTNIIMILGISTAYYVIEIQYGNSSLLKGIEHFIEYSSGSEEKSIAFREALSCRNTYLIALHFVPDHGGLVDRWASIPYKGYRLWFNEMKVSHDEIIAEVKAVLAKKKLDPQYFEDFK